MTAPGRRICVVTYYFPPSTAVGAARWDAMARHLRAAGHDVTVVTSAVHGRPAGDAPDTVRTGDLAASGVLRRGLRRPGLPEPGAAPVITPAPTLLTHGVVPDSHLVSWTPTALAAVLRRTRERPFDCIVTSGPPHSTHLVPLALAGARPAWIADFRDGWRFEPLHDAWPTRVQRRAEAWMEARVARTAEVSIGVTRPIADDLRDRLGANAAWVPNGWDADGVRSVPPPTAPEPGWISLVHTGTLSGPRGRDPRPLLRAIAAVNAKAADGAPRIRLVLAGRTTTADEALLQEVPLGDALRHLGLLDRSACVALQRDADALLLLTGNDRSEATGKLFEYLSAGRPVLALARGNEAERIVAETGTGLIVDPGDGAAIERALQELAEHGLDAHHAPRDLDRFEYPGPAVQVADLVEDAIERRARRRA